MTNQLINEVIYFNGSVLTYSAMFLVTMEGFDWLVKNTGRLFNAGYKHLSGKLS